MEMPEEINRILTDRISDLLFCPTDTAVQNLLNEGISAANGFQIVQNGDVMQDAAIHYSKISSNRSGIINALGLQDAEFVLCTIHRQENTDKLTRLEAIINALNTIHELQKVIVPLHPRTRKIIESNNLKPNFTIIDPVGYFDMIELLKNCGLVFTDSGGLQKEAYFFNKFCITMRDETEWVELVEHGFNRLVGADPEMIVETFYDLRNRPFLKSIELYGGGNAAAKVRDTLLSFL